jgi:hypothetical protein
MNNQIIIPFFHDSTAPVSLGHFIVEVSGSDSDTAHSVGILWTTDQPVTESFT